MRTEHPHQPELPDLPPGGPVVEAAAEVSDLAKLSAEVEEKGLVREHRPVFVFDKKIAAARSKNAERQERHRQRQKSKGLVSIQVPIEIAERIKSEIASIANAPNGDSKDDSKKSVREEGVRGDVVPDIASAVVTLDELIPPMNSVLQPAQQVQAATLAIEAAKAPVSAPRRLRRLTPYARRLVAAGLRIEALTGWRAWIARHILGIELRRARVD